MYRIIKMKQVYVNVFTFMIGFLAGYFSKRPHNTSLNRNNSILTLDTCLKEFYDNTYNRSFKI